MPIRVHLLFKPEDAFRHALQEQLHDDVTMTWGGELPDNPQFDILVGGRLEAAHLAASPNLTTLIIPWAGLPVKTRELLIEHPEIAVHNQHYNAAMVAESAMALLLAAAKRIVPSDRALRHHDWTVRYEPYTSSLLGGRTALILGFGAIGRAIARRCSGFDLKLLAVRRQADVALDGEVETHPTAHLGDLLPRADVLFVSLPLTPETEGLLGAEELALLPDHAIVVNIARGPIIDEEALYHELHSGRISAGLDVWYNYPDSEEARTRTQVSRFPFHELDNVVMTPHMAENGRETESFQIAELASMLNAASDGRPIPNRVDPSRGY